MNKKLLLLSITAILGISFHINSRVYAEEIVTEAITLDETIDTSETTETVSLPSGESNSTADTTDSSPEFIPGLITNPERPDGLCVMEGDIAIPCPTECYNDAGEFQACIYNSQDETYTLYETELEEGTSGEPEVVCADPNEPGCADTEVEEIADPETWPLIVSLVALGATVVIVFLINILGRKKK